MLQLTAKSLARRDAPDKCQSAQGKGQLAASGYAVKLIARELCTVPDAFDGAQYLVVQNISLSSLPVSFARSPGLIISVLRPVF